MKFPEKWHVWPDELPPENEPLRIEVLNERFDNFEKADGIFLGGKFFFTPKGREKIPFDELFSENNLPDKVYWRLWEEEDKTTWPTLFDECVALYLKENGIPVLVPHAYLGLHGWYSCEGAKRGNPIKKKLIKNSVGLAWAYIKAPSWWTPKKESKE